MYKHDGLSGIRNISGPESEMIKKKLCKIFIQHGLNVTVECNLQITDFLDVTFDLRTRKYCPYRKVKNELIYIHKESNHPPSITKQIPAKISKRISNISCDTGFFGKTVADYNNGLKTKKSNLHHNLIKKENATETIYDLIHRFASTWRPLLEK